MLVCIIFSAVLRIREELETQTGHKVIVHSSRTVNVRRTCIDETIHAHNMQRVWFLVPTVALAIQQTTVLRTTLPSHPCRLLCGLDHVDTWSTQAVWDAALQGFQIVVCTHAVLKDALVHAFVRMADICLLVFDEAHHCLKDHPARVVMEFYHSIKDGQNRPAILGLTASPVKSKNGKGLEDLERNLNAVARTPKLHREQLLQYTHCPAMIAASFDQFPQEPPLLFARLEEAFHHMVSPSLTG